MPRDTHAGLCQQIVDGTHDAVVFADRGGVIRLWNVGAEAVFGYSAAEALGESLDLIIPESLRERHWTGYRDAMARGATRYDRELLAVPARRKDGTRISIEFTIVLLRDAAGALVGPAAVIRDVSVRWRRDRELQARLARLEERVRDSLAPPHAG